MPIKRTRVTATPMLENMGVSMYWVWRMRDMWKRTSISWRMAKDDIRAAFFISMPDVASRKKGIMKWMKGSSMYSRRIMIQSLKIFSKHMYVISVCNMLGS